MANLKAISEKINTGEGTVGALIADPTVYERLVTILDGAQRSFLLRTMIRSLGKDGEPQRLEERQGVRVPRATSVYRCQQCGFASPKPGTCPDCRRSTGELTRSSRSARRRRRRPAARWPPAPVRCR
jgi:hypothetical protein